eukprot:CAMPEP_0185907180 /NCGR_PEP_ID=MMETSP0196C-20130402/6578_1 /TAXON_ID=2932 /ORGANISM="Alexandrium fundyense, Strain CCMP1719" /LENGTH=84 /DNA_ID=CAMNT_0028627089 /DNA_START=8 /DNA_END=258 /DNA_ORIENTATION=-
MTMLASFSLTLPLLHSFVYNGVIRLKVRRPSLHARKGCLAELVSPQHCDLLDVHIPDEVLMHVHAPADILLAGEERIGRKCGGL